MGSLTDREKMFNPIVNKGSISFLHGLSIPGPRFESLLVDYLVNALVKTYKDPTENEDKTIHETIEIVKRLDKIKYKKNFDVNPDYEEKIIKFLVKRSDLLDTIEKIYKKVHKDFKKKCYISLDISMDESSLVLYLYGSEISEDEVYDYIDEKLEPFIRENFSNYYYLIIDRLPV